MNVWIVLQYVFFFDEATSQLNVACLSAGPRLPQQQKKGDIQETDQGPPTCQASEHFHHPVPFPGRGHHAVPRLPNRWHRGLLAQSPFGPPGTVGEIWVWGERRQGGRGSQPLCMSHGCYRDEGVALV